MRRNPVRWRLVRSSVGLLVLTLLVGSTSDAQTKPPAGAATPPPPPDTRPLARYIPRENLVGYLEFSGLASHEEAWKKTAAYRLLNETTLGVMLEDLGAQVFDLNKNDGANRKVTGPEIVKMLKHLAYNGFVYASFTPAKQGGNPVSLLVIRSAARKDARALFSRVMLSRAPGKAELSKRPSGRSLVLMTGTNTAQKWTWWAEGDDLIAVDAVPETADYVGEVIDGKQPNAVEHPTRVELSKAEDRFEPVAFGFADPRLLENTPARSVLSGVQKVDLRWGFSDEALMSVVRIGAPKPRQGILALLDEPTFDRKSLPPMPAEIDAFSVVSLNLAKAFDLLTRSDGVLPPPVSRGLSQGVETLKTKSRLQLRKDILAHLGPKIAFYVAPGSASKSEAEPPVLPEAFAGAYGAMSAMLGIIQIPRYTLLVDVDDAVTFGHSLDGLMIFINQQLRAKFTPPADEPDADEPGGAGRPASKTARRKGDRVPTPEFRLMPGQTRSFVFSLPSELGKLPPGVRPTVRLGAKQLALSVSPESARQALEIKAGESWAPTDELTAAFDMLPDGLNVLNLSDPRDTLPEQLAGLPGQVQTTINTLILARRAAAGAAAAPDSNPRGGSRPGASTPPGQPAAGFIPPGAGREQMMRRDGEPGRPGARPPGGQAPPNQPGGANNNAGATTGVVEFNIDADKLPSAESLKELLFQSTFAIASDDQGIRIVTREAFPSLFDPKAISALATNLLPKSLLEGEPAPKAGDAAKPAAGTPATPKGVPGAPTPPPGGRRRRDLD